MAKNNFGIGKRDIKFRAWDIFSQKMWQWEEHNAFDDMRGGIKRWFEDMDLITMQHTGLRDKNRKEIYEGDVLSYIGYSAYGQDKKKSIHFVEWDENNGGFELRWLFERDDGDVGLKCEDVKIIGNIFENPELLQNDN